MIEIIIGIPLGILASFLAWWIVSHIILPKIIFSNNISHIDDPDPLYRIKIQNSGFRDIVDCEVVAEFRVKGLSKRLSKNTWILQVPVYSPRIPLIKKSNYRLIVFEQFKFSAEEKKTLSDHLSTKESYNLEDLFLLNKNSRLCIIIFAYDSYSGSRKVFISKDYYKQDIVHSPYVTGKLIVESDLEKQETKDA